MGQGWVKSIVWVAAIVGGTAGAATLRVPQVYPTIQSAVDAAAPNDTVLVGPSTYFERVVIANSLTLRSSHGATRTIIDAGHFGSAVKVFSPGPEPERVRISGFTLTHAEFIFPPTVENPDTTGAGLYVLDSIVEADHNIVEDNRSCNAAMFVISSKSTITDNIIRNNSGTWVCNFGGSGLLVGSQFEVPSETVVERNDIYGNAGPGLLAVNGGKVAIRNNHVHHNVGPQPIGTAGTGIQVEASEGQVTDNLIDHNVAARAPGMILNLLGSEAAPARKLVVTRNLLLNNDPVPLNDGDPFDSVVIALLDPPGSELKFSGNTVIGSATGALIYCEPDTQPVIVGNVLINSAGPLFTEGCPH
jgi:nitrous oxidase accessory protein NosD